MRQALPHAHRFVAVVAVVAVVAAVAGLGAVVAFAVPARAVELPGYITPLQQLTLLGAGPAGYTVARNHTQVYTARAGASFTDNGIAYAEDDQPAPAVKDVTGKELRWATQAGDVWSIHTADLRTGSAGLREVPDQPLAFTPTGYVGWAGSRITLHRAGVADRILADGVITTTGLAGGPPVADADADGALIGYALPATTDPWPTRTLVYVPLDGGDPEVVVKPAAPPGYSPTRLELTPSSFVWLAQSYSAPGFLQVWRRSRSGGEATFFTPPTDPRSGVLDFAATDQQIALAETHVDYSAWMNTTTLQVLKDEKWRSVTLPETVDGTGVFQPQQFGGVEAVGEKLVYALGSAPGQAAGVHEVTSGTIASMRENYGAVEDLALAEGRLYHADPTDADTAETAVRLIARRTIGRDPDGRLTLGAQETGQAQVKVLAWLLSRPAAPTPVRTSAVAASGDRWLLRGLSPDPHYYLASGTFATTDLGPASSGGSSLRLSGRYALAGRRVFRDPSSTPLLDLSADLEDADLFGSRVVWSTAAGQVRTQDVNDDVAVTLSSAGADGEVAIWGTDVAWVSGPTIRIAPLARPQQARAVSVTGGVNELRFTEGTLSWQDDTGRLRVLNTRSHRTTAQITGLRGPADVHDHLMTGVAANDRVQVLDLPFGQDTNYRPRLIASDTPATVTAGATWAPEFDTSKALTGVQLTIRRKGRVVTTLTGDAAHGTLAGLAWDSTGATRGTYTWTLTARAADGDGTLTDRDGSGAVKGRFTVVTGGSGSGR